MVDLGVEKSQIRFLFYFSKYMLQSPAKNMIFCVVLGLEIVAFVKIASRYSMHAAVLYTDNRLLSDETDLTQGNCWLQANCFRNSRSQWDVEAYLNMAITLQNTLFRVTSSNSALFT